MSATRLAFLNNSSDPRHGTLNGYCNLKCRCADCRAEWALYNADLRERREGTLKPDDPRHGKPTTYCNYRCRCRPCTDAHAIERRRRYQDAS